MIATLAATTTAALFYSHDLYRKRLFQDVEFHVPELAGFDGVIGKLLKLIGASVKYGDLT